MCELLAMSANTPTDICFSFAGLVQRGGNTGPHADGWGITFYEGKGCRTFKDSLSSCQSKIAELVRDYPIKSETVIGHVRQANRGGICLENTHPFTRELWGMNWTYAHNGQLSDYADLPTGPYTPVGDTDSEHAFCWILNELRLQFPIFPENLDRLWALLKHCGDKLREFGVFNMIIGNGDYLFCYCSNNLHWITRKAPFGKARLIDDDVIIDFAEHTTPNDIVTVIATQPLTNNEEWHKMQPGEAQLFKKGIALGSVDLC
jgi:glutamine amidotransferase